MTAAELQQRLAQSYDRARWLGILLGQVGLFAGIPPWPRNMVNLVKQEGDDYRVITFTFIYN